MKLGRQQKQLLDILRKAKAEDPTGNGWFSKMDFYTRVVPAITQPGARRDELIGKGFDIKSEKIIPNNNWHYYRLVSEPKPVGLPPAFIPKPPEQPIQQVSLPSI